MQIASKMSRVVTRSQHNKGSSSSSPSSTASAVATTEIASAEAEERVVVSTQAEEEHAQRTQGATVTAIVNKKRNTAKKDIEKNPENPHRTLEVLARQSSDTNREPDVQATDSISPTTVYYAQSDSSSVKDEVIVNVEDIIAMSSPSEESAMNISSPYDAERYEVLHKQLTEVENKERELNDNLEKLSERKEKLSFNHGRNCNPSRVTLNRARSLGHYDGSQDLQAFLERFEFFSEQFQWKEADRKFFLRGSLEGAAALILKTVHINTSTKQIIRQLKVNFAADTFLNECRENDLKDHPERGNNLLNLYDAKSKAKAKEKRKQGMFEQFNQLRHPTKGAIIENKEK